MTTENNQAARPRKTWSVILWSFAGLVGLVGLRLVWLGICLALGGRPATISKETTYVLGPVRPDGTIDYLAALNQRASQGVTPENNAAVPLMQVLGNVECEGHAENTTCARMMAELGTVLLPKAERLHSIDELIGDKIRAEDWDANITRPGRSPWIADQFPLMLKAIQANDSALDRIVRATQHPRYYVPRFTSPDSGMLMDVPLPDVLPARDVARLLAARAMYRLGRRERAKAASDLLACHRLARLQSQQRLPIYMLVAIAIDQVAAHGDVTLAHYGGLSRQQLTDYRWKLRDLPQLATPSECLVAERLMALDAATNLAGGVCNLHRFEPWVTTITINNRPDTHGSFLARLYDLDEMLRTINLTCDKLDAAFSFTRYKDRIAAVMQLQNEVKDRAAKTKSGSRLVARIVFSSTKQISQDMANSLCDVLLPSGALCVNVDEHSQMSILLTDVALALAEYRADHGTYPAQLAELVPKYLDTLPQDTFVGQPVIYRRTEKGFVLKSVGPDGVENSSGDRTSDDITIEMPVPAGK